MSSGYLYEPLYKIRDGRGSAELHIADQFFSNDKFDFDEFVRVCSAASNADDIEIEALSDILRLYMLAACIKPAVEPKKFLVDENGNATREISPDEEEEGATIKTVNVNKPNMILINKALQLMVARLIVEIDTALDERVEDDAFVAQINRLYAVLGAQAYAQYLTTNEDSARMPTDNSYSINGFDLTIPRPSKLARHLFETLNQEVAVEALYHFDIPRVKVMKDNRVHVNKLRANFRIASQKLKEELKDLEEKNTLTLTPGLDVLALKYESQWDRMSTVGRIMTTFADILLADGGDAMAADADVAEDYPDKVDLVSVLSRIGNNSSVVALFETASDISAQQEETRKMAKYDRYMGSLLEGGAQAFTTFFDALLRGEFAGKALEKDAVVAANAKQKLKRNVEPRVSRVKVRMDASGADREIAFLCIFLPVSQFIDVVEPSMTSLRFPLYETMTEPYNNASNSLLGKDALSAGIEDDEMLQSFKDYLATRHLPPRPRILDILNELPEPNRSNFEILIGNPPVHDEEREDQEYRAAVEAHKLEINKRFTQATKDYDAKYGKIIEDRKILLQAQIDAIYGDGADEPFNPRAGRVAFQWDSIFFHFKEKYRHGVLAEEKDKYDWMGFLVCEDPKDAAWLASQNKHRLYTIGSNYPVRVGKEPRVLLRRERKKNAAKQDVERFNVNLLRERILAEGAKRAFAKELDDKKSPHKIWLTSIPDNSLVDLDMGERSEEEEEPAQDPLVLVFSTVFNLAKAGLGTVWDKLKRRTASEEGKEEEEILLESKTRRINDARARNGLVNNQHFNLHVIPLADVEQSAFGTEAIRHSYHTEYIIFHNKGKSLKELIAYRDFLEAPLARAKSARQKAASVSSPSKDSPVTRESPPTTGIDISAEDLIASDDPVLDAGAKK